MDYYEKSIQNTLIYQFIFRVSLTHRYYYRDLTNKHCNSTTIQHLCHHFITLFDVLITGLYKRIQSLLYLFLVSYFKVMSFIFYKVPSFSSLILGLKMIDIKLMSFFIGCVYITVNEINILYC